MNKGQQRECFNWRDPSNQPGKRMKKYLVEFFYILLGEKYYKLSVMIGIDTSWLLNLENPDLDYTFLCNTKRNGSNIIFAGNCLEKY